MPLTTLRPIPDPPLTERETRMLVAGEAAILAGTSHGFIRRKLMEKLAAGEAERPADLPNLDPTETHR